MRLYETHAFGTVWQVRSKSKFLRSQLRRVGGCEVVRAQSRGYSFPRHYHDGYTIGLVTGGREVITGRGVSHGLSSGALYFSNPGEAHDGRAVDDDGWSFVSLYVPPAIMAQGALAHEPLFEGLRIDHGNLAVRFARAFAVLASSECRIETESAISALIDLALSHNSTGAGAPTHPRARPDLKRVQDYIDEHYLEDISLQSLASLANLHSRHLITAFRNCFGITPHAYLTTRRLNAAYRAISAGAPIAQAAIACGFYDQSHLHRHFKSKFGFTPDALARAFKS